MCSSFRLFFFLYCLLFRYIITIGIKASSLISAMTTIKYDVPLLDHNTRFSLWQVNMRAILAQMDLDDALLGFDKIPLSWTKEEKQCKDRKALSHIHLHLSNQILQDVLKEKTATALWLKLKHLCMTKSLSSKLHLKHQIYSLHMEEGMSLEDHKTTFKETIFDLETIKVKYDEEDLGLILLCSLPLLIRILGILFCIVMKSLLWMKYMMAYFQRRR